MGILSSDNNSVNGFFEKNTKNIKNTLKLKKKKPSASLWKPEIPHNVSLEARKYYHPGNTIVSNPLITHVSKNGLEHAKGFKIQKSEIKNKYEVAEHSTSTSSRVIYYPISKRFVEFAIPTHHSMTENMRKKIQSNGGFLHKFVNGLDVTDIRTKRIFSKILKGQTSIKLAVVINDQVTADQYMSGKSLPRLITKPDSIANNDGERMLVVNIHAQSVKRLKELLENLRKALPMYGPEVFYIYNDSRSNKITHWRLRQRMAKDFKLGIATSPLLSVCVKKGVTKEKLLEKIKSHPEYKLLLYSMNSALQVNNLGLSEQDYRPVRKQTPVKEDNHAQQQALMIERVKKLNLSCLRAKREEVPEDSYSRYARLLKNRSQDVY